MRQKRVVARLIYNPMKVDGPVGSFVDGNGVGALDGKFVVGESVGANVGWSAAVGHGVGVHSGEHARVTAMPSSASTPGSTVVSAASMDDVTDGVMATSVMF